MEIFIGTTHQRIIRAVFALAIVWAVLLAPCTGTEPPGLHYAKGERLLEDGQFLAAVEYFNKTLERYPDNPEVWAKRGDALKALKMCNESLESYDRALDLLPPDSAEGSDILTRKGDALRESRRYNESLEAYDSALRIDGGQIGALTGRMNACASMKDYEGALSAARQRAAADPDNKGYRYQVGYYLQVMGRHAEAVPAFDDAIAIDQDYAEAVYRKGLSLQIMGWNTEAMKLYERTILLNPNHKAAINARGVALESEGRYDEALASYDRALKIDQNYYQAMNNRMHALIVAGRNEEAMGCMARL